MSDTVKECPVCGYHFWELVGCPNGCKTARNVILPSLKRALTDINTGDYEGAGEMISAVITKLTTNDNNDRVQSLCDSCNMVNCKIKRDWGVVAVKCNEYMEA